MKERKIKIQGWIKKKRLENYGEEVKKWTASNGHPKRACLTFLQEE